MLFMLIVKGSRNSEGANIRDAGLDLQMDQYNVELIKAGVRVMAKGLRPSSEGIRISFPIEGGKPVVTNGPFAPADELIAGFFLIDVKSREEAIKWAMRAPDPQGHGEGQIELRQVNE